MKPISIKIENYRSISEVTINIEDLDDKTRTFGFIGVNEAGKSSILRAIALINSNENPAAKDFRDYTKSIAISITYRLDDESKGRMTENVDTQDPSEAEIVEAIKSAKTASIITSFDSSSLKRTQAYYVEDRDDNRTDLSFSIVSPVQMPRAIFWTAEKKYLMTEPVQLAQFAADPGNVSIPLKNCFHLAGYLDIQKSVSDLKESTDKEHLEETLGGEVTNHILKIWPGHPIKITFSIDNGMLSFHVKDEGSRAKAKTVDQRSDGFKQFISFLLTISAENVNANLTNTILLIDEPETHLHPKAQQHLLEEFKKITATENGNVVLFATHSTFLIDKKDLSRYYRVKKDGDQSAIERLGKTAISFSEVNFRVFGIYSTDFHSEIYSKLHSQYQAEDEADDKRSQIQSFDKNFFQNKQKIKADRPWKAKANDATLPTYIRNCINHPDNGHTYTDEELIKSTDLLLKILG